MSKSPSLAAPSHSPSLTLELFFLLFILSYSPTQWFLSIVTKLEPPHASRKERKNFIDVVEFKKKIFLGQELIAQGWVERQGTGTRCQRWDVVGGDVTSPIFSGFQPLQQPHQLLCTWIEAPSSVFLCQGCSAPSQQSKPTEWNQSEKITLNSNHFRIIKMQRLP